jgi:hypothetical protein
MYLDMSLILQAMLSTGSLAAFTAAAPQAQQLRPSFGVNLPAGIRPAAAQSSSTSSAGGSSLKLQPQGSGSAAPNRATPRGSLLDLSV